MKNNRKSKMYFPARLPALIIVACIAVIALGGVGIGLSVWRLLRFDVRAVFDTVRDILLLPICTFCILTPLTIMLRSGYTVTDKTVLQHFGFFRTRYEVEQITALVLNSEKGQLTMEADGQAVVILIAPDKAEAFTRTLLSVNPDIDYGFTLSDNPPKDQNHKE